MRILGKWQKKTRRSLALRCLCSFFGKNVQNVRAFFGVGYAINLLCKFKPVIILMYVNERAYPDATKYEE